MSGVILVAPRDAAWARRAEAMLADLRLHVARAHDLRITGFLLLSGGVSALLLDPRCTGSTWRAHRERLRSLSPTTRILVVGDAPLDAEVADAIAWPDDPAAALALITGAT